MSRRFQRQSGAPGIIFGFRGILLDAGSTVPADATAGYETGCLFLKTNGAAGTDVYRNVGSITSADFNVLTGVDLSALTGVTAAELSLLTGLTASGAEISRTSTRVGHIVNATLSTLAVTELAHDKKTILLDRAAGIAVTLPVAAAGLEFTFIIKTTFTGAASIKSVSGADIMIGHAIMGNDSDNTVVNFQAVAANTFDTIDMLGTANSTGGMAGQRIHIKGLAANLWYVEIIGDAAGTEATPFQDTVT